MGAQASGVVDPRDATVLKPPNRGAWAYGPESVSP